MHLRDAYQEAFCIPVIVFVYGLLIVHLPDVTVEHMFLSTDSKVLCNA